MLYASILVSFKNKIKISSYRSLTQFLIMKGENMNKLMKKILGLTLGLAMSVGVGVAASSGKISEAKAADKPLTFSFTSCPSGWPSGSSASANTKTYTISGVAYEFSLGPNVYYNTQKYLMLKSTTYLGLPAISDYKLTKIEATNSSGCSTKTKIAVTTASDGKTNVGGGSAQTWSKTSTTYTYNLSSTVANTMYYLYITAANCQITNLKLTYTEVVSTYKVTYDGNGNSSGNVPTDATAYSKDATVTVLGNTGNLAKTGYSFGGWNTQADGNGITYGAGQTFDITANTTLYAKWNLNNYSVSTTITNGSSTAPTSINHGSALNFIISASDGYRIPSSKEDISVTMGGSPYTSFSYNDVSGAFSITSVTGDVVVTATCEEAGQEYTVTYNLTGCTLDQQPTTLYGDSEATFRITVAEHYKLPEDVGATNVTTKTYNKASSTLYIAQPTDNVVITIACEQLANPTIGVTATNVTAASTNPTTVEEGKPVTLTFTANTDYVLPSSVNVQGAASSSWDQSTGKLSITGGTENITVTISGEEKVIDHISLSKTSGSYKLGETLEMPTVTAYFNQGSANVTSQATFSGDCLDQDGMFIKTGSNQPVTISYTYRGITKTATYSATVTAVTPSSEKYEKVTSTPSDWAGTYLLVYESSETVAYCWNGVDGASDYETTTISSGVISSAPTDASTLTIASMTDGYSLKINGGANDGKYLYHTGSSNTLDVSTTATANELSIDSGSASIKVGSYILRFNNNSGQYRFRYYKSGQQPVQLYKYVPGTNKSLIRITAQAKSDVTFFAGDSVTIDQLDVKAFYNDSDTGVAKTSNVNISLPSGVLEKGDNELTISYTEGGITKSCTLIIQASERTAKLIGLQWEQGAYAIIDGNGIEFSRFATINALYDVGDPSPKRPEDCEVALYVKSGDEFIKDSDIDDGSILTISEHEGLYLGVTYTEEDSFTAYSSAPLDFVERINSVRDKEESWTWSKVKSLSDIKIGDYVTFVNEDDTMVASGYDTSKKVITTTEYSSGTIQTNLKFKVGKSGSYYTFENENGYLGCHNTTGTSSSNEVHLDKSFDTENNQNSFTLSIDNEENVLITSVKATDRDLRYNYNNGNARFSFYMKKDGSPTQDPLQLYVGTKGYTPIGNDYANTNTAVQKAVLQYARAFNELLDCQSDGSTSGIASKWSQASTEFSTALSAWEGDNLAHFKTLFAYADARSQGDTLQDMLARYEYILGKYQDLSLTDFIAEATQRNPVARIANHPFGILNMENSTPVILIVVASVLAVTAIGGYFFIRKRKELN